MSGNAMKLNFSILKFRRIKQLIFFYPSQQLKVERFVAGSLTVQVVIWDSPPCPAVHRGGPLEGEQVNW